MADNRDVVETMLVFARTLRVAGLDDAPAGCGQLGDPGPYFRLQAGVGHGQPGHGGHAVHQNWIVDRQCVVNQYGDASCTVGDFRDGSVPTRRWQLDVSAGVIDVAALLGDPVPDDQRRIAKRPGQLISKARTFPLAETHDQIGHSGLSPTAEHQVHEQQDDDRHDHRVVRVQHGRFGVPAGKTLNTSSGQNACEGQRSGQCGPAGPAGRSGCPSEDMSRCHRDQSGQPKCQSVVACNRRNDGGEVCENDSRDREWVSYPAGWIAQ